MNNSSQHSPSLPTGLNQHKVYQFYSGQKQQKVQIDHYGGSHVKYVKYPPKFVPMNRLQIIDERKVVQLQDDKSNKMELLKTLRKRNEIIQGQKREQMQLLQEKFNKIKLKETKKIELKRAQEQMIKVIIQQNNLKQKQLRQRQIRIEESNKIIGQYKQVICTQEKQHIMAAKKIHQTEMKVVQKKNELSKIEQSLNIIQQKKQIANAVLQKQSQKMRKRIQTIEQLRYQEKIKKDKLEISQMQISVLRIQINPLLRVGFTTVSLDPEGDRKRILDKGSNSWQNAKNKHISPNQIRDYLVLQLYPHWKELLNKVSSSYSGYPQILCYRIAEENQTIKDLMLYIPQRNQTNNKYTNSRIRSLIVFYSPIPQNRVELIKILQGLVGLKNTIINIRMVKIEDVQDCKSEIIISYDYMGEERSKKIELNWLKEVSRDTILKYMPNSGDKAVLLKIQIPLIPVSIYQKNQFEEVYNLIKRSSK